jgi:hypothetical protein
MLKMANNESGFVELNAKYIVVRTGYINRLKNLEKKKIFTLYEGVDLDLQNDGKDDIEYVDETNFDKFVLPFEYLGTSDEIEKDDIKTFLTKNELKDSVIFKVNDFEIFMVVKLITKFLIGLKFCGFYDISSSKFYQKESILYLKIDTEWG